MINSNFKKQGNINFGTAYKVVPQKPNGKSLKSSKLYTRNDGTSYVLTGNTKKQVDNIIKQGQTELETIRKTIEFRSQTREIAILKEEISIAIKKVINRDLDPKRELVINTKKNKATKKSVQNRSKFKRIG